MSDPSPQGPLALRIAGRDLLLGLRWERATRPDTGLSLSRRDLAARAREKGFDRLVPAAGRLGLFRLGDFPRRLKKPVSLAALCALSAPQGQRILELAHPVTGSPLWWVWAAAEGTLSVRADRLFAREEEALALCADLAETLGLDPPERLDRTASRRFLTGLLARARRDGLRRSSPVPSGPFPAPRKALLLVLFLALSGLAAAGPALLQRLDPARSLPFLRNERERLEARKQAVLARPEAHFQALWLVRPPAGLFWEDRLPRLLATPLVEAGWRLESLTAGLTGLERVWRATARASLLRPPPGARPDAREPEQARGEEPLPALSAARAARPADLLPEETARLRLAEISRRFGLRLRLRWDPPETLRIGDAEFRAPWRRGIFSWEDLPESLPADPRTFARALEMPGLVLTEIRRDRGRWSCSGEIHARH